MKQNKYQLIKLNGKRIGLYFGAYSSPSCRNFTPKLTVLFKANNSEKEDTLEIVFISSDDDQATFDKYFKEMHWKALPFSDRDRSKALREKFNVNNIPALVMLSPTCEIDCADDTRMVHDLYHKSIRRWCKGKHFFGSREPREGEYVWYGIICHECYMCPIIGSRYGCANEKCYIDLCETCLPKYNHEHPFVQYLEPKRQYSFEQIFESVPYLLNPNSEEKIETKTLWENGIKMIGVYYSAHWCGPCREFTPKLIEVYKEAQAMALPFRIVFISSDFDEQSFNEYRSEMPWPTVPLKTDIPRLFIVSSDGKVLSHSGVQDVSRKGIEAVKTWVQGETVAPPTADEFEWEDVECAGCKMKPIIGQRYRCSTCESYDLCSACEKKGHEHPLELVPQPTEDEDE